MLQVIRDWTLKSNKAERIWLMAKIEFKLRYYENKLGLLWALIKPLTDILIFYIAFEVVMKQGIPNYVSFLFIGLILWNFFVESTTGTVQLLKVKKYLYEYSNMNKLEIYISTIMSNVIGFFFNFIMFCIYYYMIAEGHEPISWKALFIIPIFLNLVILSLGFSIILSNLYVIARDITQVWAVLVGLGFWLSPILFKLETFREAIPILEYANPVSSIIINARKVILENQLPDWNTFYFSFLYSFFFLLIGIVLLNKIGSKASEKL